jgi:hypothetical protein
MEDIKTMLDNKMPIAEIKKGIHQYIYSADGYPDKLSLVFVMRDLIQEGSNLLQSINSKDFISQVDEMRNEVVKRAESLSEEYHTQYDQDNRIIDVLRNNDNTQINKLQKEIHDMLSTYDGIINTLVEERERLPLLDITKE